MGYFRFRRRIRILPGLTLNVGKRGLSTSVGIRGAHVTVGHGKVRETVGLPGSGLSYTTAQSTRSERQDGAGEAQAPVGAARPSMFGRAVRVIALGILGAFVLSVMTLWALATFLH